MDWPLIEIACETRLGLKGHFHKAATRSQKSYQAFWSAMLNLILSSLRDHLKGLMSRAKGKYRSTSMHVDWIYA